MYLFIENAMLQVWSDCDTLRITLDPRRSVRGTGTRVTMHADGLQPYTHCIEKEPPSAAAQWVWTGALQDAQRIVDRVLHALHHDLMAPDIGEHCTTAEESATVSAYASLLDRFIDEDLRAEVRDHSRPMTAQLASR